MLKEKIKFIVISLVIIIVLALGFFTIKTRNELKEVKTNLGNNITITNQIVAFLQQATSQATNQQ